MRTSVAVAVIALLIVGACLGNHESGIDVCTRTGMIRYSQVYGPFRFNSVRPTPLSQVLVRSGFRNVNDHDWVGAWSGGRRFGSGRFCALGDADLLRSSIESTNVAAVIQVMITNNEKARCEKWLGWVFDPKISHLVGNYAWDFEELTNRSDLLTWLDQREAMILEDLAIENECSIPLTNQ
jgi:hypothetical protein